MICVAGLHHGNGEIQATEKTAARYEINPETHNTVLKRLKKFKRRYYKPLLRAAERKGDNVGTIIGIILLALAAIYLGGCGLGLIIVGLGGLGLGPPEASVVLLGLLGVVLAFLCVKAIVKSLRKMRQQKNGEPEPENVPRHPPTKRKE